MASETKAETRRRVLDTASELLERDGVAALSTRAVAAAAGVRAASLYQLFGDKNGLLSALAVGAFEEYLADKHSLNRSGDPVTDMRRGWDSHVAFGLGHPALYLVMYGPDRPGLPPPAAHEAHRQLMAFLADVAEAGRLRIAPDLAAQLLYAGVTGATLTLIATPEPDRAADLSARLRDTVVGSLITDPAPGRATSQSTLAARALRLDAALADEQQPLPLRPAEAALLRDWLHQLTR